MNTVSAHAATEGPLGIDRAKIGKQLLIAAWAVEILAASIGLLIATLIVVSTYSTIGKSGVDQDNIASGMMSAFLGGLPFVMVAAIELTKIPLATAYFHSENRLWKWLLALGLLLLMIITFETMLNGFERNFTQRTYVIKEHRKSIQLVEANITNSKTNIAELRSMTSESNRAEFTKEMNSLEESQAREIADVDKQIEQAKVQYSGRGAQTIAEQKSEINDEILALDREHQASLSILNEEFSARTKETNASVEARRNAIKDDIKSTEKTLANLRQTEQKELSAIKDTKSNSNTLERQIKNIEADFDKRRNAAESGVNQARKELLDQIKTDEDNLRNIINERDIKIEKENDDRPFTSKETIRAEITAQYLPQVSPIRERLSALNRKLSETDLPSALNKLNREKDEEIQRARDNFADENNRGVSERDKIRQKYNTERNNKQNRLENLRNQLANLTPQAANKNLSDEKSEKVSNLVKKHKSDRKQLIVERDKLSEKLALALRKGQDKAKPVLDRLSTQRETIKSKYKPLKELANFRYQERQKELTSREAKVGSLEKKLLGLEEKRIKLRDKISREAEDSQIYRVAALWTGKDSPADVTNDELRLISLIWFGSLAAITAWTGTLLAFGGLAVQYGRRSRESSIKKGALSVLLGIRRLIITQRKLKLSPREKIVEKEVQIPHEVIKEVPVDKVVFKEVPKEVVRRELVYVPFLTNDLEQLNGHTLSDHYPPKDNDIETSAEVISPISNPLDSVDAGHSKPKSDELVPSPEMVEPVLDENSSNEGTTKPLEKPDKLKKIQTKSDDPEESDDEDAKKD